MGLVDYDSEEEEDTSIPLKRSFADHSVHVNTKKRALPPLPKAFDQAHEDDPTLHQGRKRSRPFVTGEYSAHIYISVELPSTFNAVLEDIRVKAAVLCPSYKLHSLVRDTSSTSLASTDPQKISIKRVPLHISLTHPLALRRSQIASFRDELASQLKLYTQDKSIQRPLKISFAGRVVGYMNGRRTGGEGDGGRAFLALRVSAGAKEIEETVERVLHPLLHKLHLPLYHNNPEFHASFAWCHLDLSAEQSEVGSEEDVAEGWQELDSRTPLEPDSGTGSFSPRTPFTAKILDELSTEFQARIMASQPAGGWQVNHLDLKVAKQVHRLEF